MQNSITTTNRFSHGLAKSLCATVLAAALGESARADEIKAPAVAAQIQVPAGNKAFLIGQAAGTQNYICRPAGGGVKFMLFTPEAMLSEGQQQLTSHFFSPNPFEANTDATVRASHMIRPTWRHSRDTSMVWAKPVPDAVSAAPNTIPWLLLQVVGAQAGPNGGATLTSTTFIQRINTSGGMAPTDGCAVVGDIGNQAYVPYSADYVFYKKAAGGAGDGR